jgi:hypothetical protein
LVMFFMCLLSFIGSIVFHVIVFAVTYFKAWNKRYRIAVCNVKYAYCDTTLQGDLPLQFFFKFKKKD